MNQKLRIIAGNLRGRIINFAKVGSDIALRPTSDRIRETLFNWLGQDLSGCNCLDLFAGSGILGLESLSRNANSVIFNDKNKTITKNILQNLQLLNLTEKSTLYNFDSFDLLQNLIKQNLVFDVIFIDPPFHKNIIQQLLQTQYLSKISHKNTHIYIESEQKFTETEFPADFELFKHKKAGEVNAHLFIKK